MSETKFAPSSEPNPNAQKSLETSDVQLSDADKAAFEALTAGVDINEKAIVDDEKQKAAEKQQLNKLAELNVYLEDPKDRRQGLKAIFKSDLPDKMSDAEVEAFIADKLEISTPEKAAEKQLSKEEMEQQLIDQAPKGVPTVEEVEADLESEGPVKIGLWKRARRLAGAPGRAIWKGYSRLLSMNEKQKERLEAMSDEEREKYERRANVISLVATAAIAGAYFANKFNMIPDLNGGGGKAERSDAATAAILPTEEEPQAPAGPTPEEIARKEHESQFIYDPNKDPFNNPARHEFNFRAALDTSSPEAARADLLQGLKGAPDQLAVFMAAEGMIPNDLDSITQATDLMRADPSIAASNFDAVELKMQSSPVSIVENNGSTPYGSWSMVDNGDGTHSMAYQPVVYDTQPFLQIGNTTVGCECGQVLDLPQGGATQNYQAAPAIGGGTYEAAPSYFTESTPPQGGGNYTPPTIEQPPTDQPPVDQPPTDQPPTDQPPTDVPEEHKGNAYPGHELLTTDLGPGEFMKDPVTVITEQITQTGRDIGGGQTEAPIIDTVTNTQGSQTGGQDKAPDVVTTPQDTSGNAGAGTGVEAESGAGTGTTQSGTATSR